MKKRIRNNGIVPQYYVENDHDGIIPKEIFMQVQEELVRRRCVQPSTSGKKRSFSSNHCFAQIVMCGTCGEIFRRIHWNNHGKKSIVWRCVSRLENTGLYCDARTVLESELQRVAVEAINQVLAGKDEFLATLEQNIATVLSAENQTALAEIEYRLTELQNELLKRTAARTDYDDVAEEIYRLREQKQKLQLESASLGKLRNRITEMSMFIQEQSTAITEYEESLIRRLIEKVTVYEDRFTIEFKSGLVADLENSPNT
jgi:site-specific DNA recombinase